MKTKTSRWGVAGIVVMAFFLGGFSQTGDDLFQKALRLEKNEGKLMEAIGLYQKVIAGQSSKSLAAQAQLRIGMCYEKMGTAEAVKAYEIVIEKYSDQAEAVAEARGRLAALRKEEPEALTMSRLLPPEVYLDCQALSPDGTKVAGIDFEKGQNVAVYDLPSKKLKYVTNYDWENEGLWTYVPVWSPDGQGIAFQAGAWGDDSARMLWISNLAGKARKCFENPYGFVVPCDWLPNGTAILAVYANEKKTASLGLISVKEGELREICQLLRTSSRGGDPVQAQTGRSADVSPDGQYVAFSDGPTNGSRGISIISMDGGSKAILTDHPAEDIEPRWSPDGRHIVFLSDRHGSWALWGVAVRDGGPDGQPFMILEGMQDSGLSSWTKRGLLSTTLAVIMDIYTLEIDPRSHRPLGKPRVVDFTPSGSNYLPLWSPDGKYLAFLTPWRGPLRMSGDCSVIVMPSEGKGGRIFRVPTPQWQSRWLPDGSGLEFTGFGDDQSLLYHRLELETGKWTSHPIPAAGISDEGSAGVASDEGKSCFYIFQRNPGRDGSEPGVFALNPETGQKRYILKKNEVESLPRSSPSVSRDNKRLATGRDGEIALIEIDTGHIEKLEYKKEGLSFPAWSPDGKHLVASGRTGEGEEWNDLFIVSLADGQVKCLNINRYLPRKAQIWQMPDMSPDGRKIAFCTRMWKVETNLIQNMIPKK
jgi:Tol biopolymer transport system component